MKYIRLEKIGEAKNPVSRAGEKAHYVRGRLNQEASLPIAYFLEGWLKIEPTAGENLILYRTVSDGVRAQGVFISTVVMETRGDEFLTMNSIYRMTVLPSSAQIPWP